MYYMLYFHFPEIQPNAQISKRLKEREKMAQDKSFITLIIKLYPTSDWFLRTPNVTCIIIGDQGSWISIDYGMLQAWTYSPKWFCYKVSSIFSSLETEKAGVSVVVTGR